MQFIESVFGLIGDLTWGQSLIPLLVVFGVFITALTGFVQFEFFRRMFRVLSKNNQSADPNAISARAALLISVGGRVGGGNIAGVAVAITLGGPGAVFWMWAIALLGMATSLVACSLAQIYKRRQPDGSFRGGPARSIIHGLGANFRWLAVLYAVCLIAAFGLGSTRSRATPLRERFRTAWASIARSPAQCWPSSQALSSLAAFGGSQKWRMSWCLSWQLPTLRWRWLLW